MSINLIHTQNQPLKHTTFIRPAIILSAGVEPSPDAFWDMRPGREGAAAQ